MSSPSDALRQAVDLLGLSGTVGGTAHRVRRLDRTGEAYWLVHAGGHVACLDAATGRLMASAASSAEPLTLSEGVARALANAGSDATVQLVWAPARATLSMFDPLWLVELDGRAVYVDQRGKVWRELLPPGRGG